MAIANEWSLRLWVRALILGFCAIYLLITHPWSIPDTSVAIDHYTVAAALITLAVLPKRTRLVVALALSVGAAFLALFVGRALLGG